MHSKVVEVLVVATVVSALSMQHAYADDEFSEFPVAKPAPTNDPTTAPSNNQANKNDKGCLQMVLDLGGIIWKCINDAATIDEPRRNLLDDKSG